MEKNNPLVTVYMPTHNRSDLLPRAIESVLNQTYKNLELIVVDDGSKDNTIEILEKYSKKDTRVRFFRHEKAKGACAARNLAIENAKGQYITGLDDDDLFEEDRLSYFMENLNDRFSFITTPLIQYYSEDNKKIFRSKKSIVTKKEILYENVVGNQVFTKTEILKKLGGFDIEFKAWQDYEMWTRIVIAYGDGLILSKPTYTVRFDHELNRITKSKNRLTGIKQYLNKYAYQMDKEQINRHNLSICLEQNDILTLRTAARYVDKKNCIKVVYHLIRSFKVKRLKKG